MANILNLLVAEGDNRIDRAALEQIKTPAADKTWCPIPHTRLIQLVVGALANLNMRVVAESHAIARNGARYFGMMQVANCQENTDYSYVLGLRNSHDKSFPAGLAVGAGIFVCTNLSFSGEISIARKHTTFIDRDLPILTSRAVGMLSDKWNDQDRRFDAYKKTELTDAQAHDMVIRLMDAGACTTTQIPRILTEWRTPRHPEFAKDGKTAWRLFNGVTEVAKESSVFTLPKRTQSLHALMDSTCGVMSKAEVITADTTDTVVVTS